MVQLLRDALDRLKKANERIEILEKGLNDSLTPKLPVPYSVRSEEARKERKKRLDQKNKEKKKPLRSGRIKTEEKIAKAKRHEDVYPIGVDPSTCSLSHVRPIIRIEAGQAFWIAYHIYRAPNGTYGRVQGALGRSEFGLEIILAIAYQVYALGLSFDKAIAQKCWAHLLRKAIKLTLLDPQNKEYIDFADGAFQIFYDGRSLQKNQSISEDERDAEIVKLEDRVLALCSVREIETEKLDDPTADSFRLLRRELLGLSLREELFTFVSNPAVAPTNNEAERTLRDAATARRVGRTNKTPRGARRQTIVLSVFESIRTQVPTYTLQGVLNEISSWKTLGESCFTRLMKAAGLTPNDESVLDKLFPNKGKPLPEQLAAA